MQSLENTIKQLIISKHEGEYWDFKVEHHSNCAELLHDILCFSNSLYQGDKYIIYGVSDNYDIVGFNENSMRRKQSEIIDFLRVQKFAGGFRPEVEVKNFTHSQRMADIVRRLMKIMAENQGSDLNAKLHSDNYEGQCQF